MSLTPKLYQLKENQFLQTSYHIIGPHACSQHLGRTYQSIVTQAHRLGLKSNKFQIPVSILNKICGRCQEEKSKSCFGKDKNRSDGLYPLCKECLKSSRQLKISQKSDYDKLYRKINHNKIKNYIQNNKQKIRLRARLYNRKWRKIPHNHILQNLRSRFRKALQNKCKVAHTIELLGCSVLQFKNYLESKFKTGMSWNNYGQWHIDHIKPCISFDLTNSQQQKECFHYTNMQPLWALDNLSKGKN